MREKTFIDVKKSNFLSANDVNEAKRVSQEVRANASSSRRAILDGADQAFDEVNKSLDDEIDLQGKFRKAGYSMSQAESILTYMKDKPIGVPFQYEFKIFVRTPYNTVVEAHVYIDTLQNQLIQLTSLSFIGLIKLAFKRLLGKG